MRKVKLVLGGVFIVFGIAIAVGILPQMMEAQKERRADLKSKLLEYSKLDQNH